MSVLLVVLVAVVFMLAVILLQARAIDRQRRAERRNARRIISYLERSRT